MSSRGRPAARGRARLGMAKVREAPDFLSPGLGTLRPRSCRPAGVEGASPRPAGSGLSHFLRRARFASFVGWLCPPGGRNRCLPPTASRAGWLRVGLLHKTQVSCREMDRLYSSLIPSHLFLG